MVFVFINIRQKLQKKIFYAVHTCCSGVGLYTWYPFWRTASFGGDLGDFGGEGGDFGGDFGAGLW